MIDQLKSIIKDKFFEAVTAIKNDPVKTGLPFAAGVVIGLVLGALF
ncbi:hypothetical protein [Nitrosomonas sp. Nm58]|nr:hypothetical protein [Nitrosomonas sp. Nm58]SDY24344.1 hypothetical protein SAMN05421754_100488 [Nitrosomonas sp. Nm58]